uniref:50S ribosomal protein L29 n=1 Tax=Analipus japonicus TaxID=31333 RepID=UPI002E79ACD5|nr:50S ribosomal protein L29 [Analipus japonicus]WAM61887.1 50S ribosomal protein L29 [Analipus japonicus]
MSLPKINEIKDLTKNDLENEILNIKKELFKLRISRKTKKVFKSHQLKHQKHRLAQLLMIQNSN